MVNAILRTKPGMLSLASKAINSIYNKPDSIFVTAKAMDILFDGVLIHCGVKDFAGKAVCTQLKESPDLRHVGDDDLAFSFMSPVGYFIYFFNLSVTFNFYRKTELLEKNLKF